MLCRGVCTIVIGDHQVRLLLLLLALRSPRSLLAPDVLDRFLVDVHLALIAILEWKSAEIGMILSMHMER